MTAPPLTCYFGVNNGVKDYQKMLSKIYEGIEGLQLEYVTNWLVYLHGEVDPIIFIQKLYKARSFIEVFQIDYGRYEENPQGIRKPNSNFVSCSFKLINKLDISWYKTTIGALKAIQGVSFTICAPAGSEYQMVYFYGNIEIGVLMKMLVKTGIEPSTMKYGPPDPKPDQAPANGTEKQPAKDTVPPLPPPPPPAEVVSTSTKHQVIYKKPWGFRRFCC